MEWLLLIPFVAMALYLCLLLAIWLADIGYAQVVWAMGTLTENLGIGAAQAVDRLARTARRTRAERRFAMAAGTSASVDQEAVEAAAQIRAIRHVLDKELPNSIVRCIRIHRLSAAAR